MNPKPRRFPRGTVAATLGAGATAAALLLAPAVSNAATDEPDDTVEATTPEDAAATAEPDTDDSDPGVGSGDDRVIIIPGGPGGPLHPGGPERPDVPGRVDRGPGGPRLRLIDPELIAATIGIDVDVLAEELRSGATIAEIAEANGVDPQTVIDALVAEYTERVTDWIAGDQSTPDADDTASTETTEA